MPIGQSFSMFECRVIVLKVAIHAWEEDMVGPIDGIKSIGWHFEFSGCASGSAGTVFDGVPDVSQAPALKTPNRRPSEATSVKNRKLTRFAQQNQILDHRRLRP
jgi:hypothetical protein